MASHDDGESPRSAFLPPPTGAPQQRPSAASAPASPPAPSTPPAAPKTPSVNPAHTSTAPPPGTRMSRFTFAEWFRNSVPAVRMPIKRIVPRVRRSLLPIEDFVRTTVVPWVPRWRGWSAARTLTVFGGFGLFMLALVLLTPRSVKRYVYRRATWFISLRSSDVPDVDAQEPGDRADADLKRDEHSSVAGGILSIPPSFSSADGAYDVVLHFHGNTELVEESFAVAKVNAVVLIENLGIGSGAYEDRFTSPEVFRDTLARIDEALVRRGLRSPKRRRIAVTAWSAGYGAAVRIIEHPDEADDVDAVLLLDGIHASFLPDGSIDPARIAPYQHFAERAIAGQKLFVITHSEIKPPDYPGTHATTDAVLELVGVVRSMGGHEPPFPELSSFHGVPKSKIIPLKPLSEAHAGDFHVYGYAGETAEDHISHLVEMSTTALPYLVKRWQ